jgi:hypothetical protein
MRSTFRSSQNLRVAKIIQTFSLKLWIALNIFAFLSVVVGILRKIFFSGLSGLNECSFRSSEGMICSFYASTGSEELDWHGKG